MIRWILIALVVIPSLARAETIIPMWRFSDLQSVGLWVVVDSDCPFNNKQVEIKAEEEFSKKQIKRSDSLRGHWLQVKADCASFETVDGTEHVTSFKVLWPRYNPLSVVDHGGLFVSGKDEVTGLVLGQIGAAVEHTLTALIELNLPPTWRDKDRFGPRDDRGLHLPPAQ